MTFTWPPYFPIYENLIPLSQKHMECIETATNILTQHAVMPHKIRHDIKNIKFYYDETLPFGVLGYAEFFKKNRIILSKLISDALLWESITGKPNNEMAMGTVIHELTHLQQMKDWKWYGWIIINNPLIKYHTIEKWANENGSFAQKFLLKYYHDNS